jgi:hypothetical protein
MYPDSVYIAGAGPIGMEYADSLMRLGVHPVFLLRQGSRSISTVENRGFAFDLIPASGDLSMKPGASLIVALPILAQCAFVKRVLLRNRNLRILIEKPISVASSEILSLINVCDVTNCVYGAFNRRFFPSVIRLKHHLRQCPPTKLALDISERFDEVKLKKIHPEAVIKRWAIANSCHMIDLAFHLVGANPTDFVSERIKRNYQAAQGELDASGRIGDIKVQFVANWKMDARWSVRGETHSSIFSCQPIESTCIQLKTSGDIIKVSDYEPEFGKTGFLQMTKAFLENDSCLPDLSYCYNLVEFIERYFYDI